MKDEIGPVLPSSFIFHPSSFPLPLLFLLLVGSTPKKANDGPHRKTGRAREKGNA